MTGGLSTPFLFGMLGAWSIAQVAIGVFFVLAHRVARREAEYLLFGFLCFALAVTTSGMAFGYGAQDVQTWRCAAQVAFAGGSAAAALNLHFVMRYAEVKSTQRVAIGAYGTAALFEVTNLLGLWWSPAEPTLSEVTMLGARVKHVIQPLSAVGTLFWGVVMGGLLSSLVALYLAWRGGKREALLALLGGAVLALAVANDAALGLGLHSQLTYMIPHGFMIYAFAVASTLLLRYRSTQGELVSKSNVLEQRTRELRHSYVELRHMQDELVKKKQLAAVGELAAAIAHEVRNPLAVIVNAIAGLRRAGLAADDRDMLLGIVDEETQRLNRLVTDLLRFARPVSVKRTMVSIPELARHAQRVTREHHRVELSIDEHPALQAAMLDAGLMRLVIENIVDNACQAMPDGGVVHIAVRCEAEDGMEHGIVEVSDDGHGMEADVLERAMDPFFTTRPSGTGLGLPIVERILEAHGGRLEIDSDSERGTMVRIHLPLVGEEAESSGSIAMGG